MKGAGPPARAAVVPSHGDALTAIVTALPEELASLRARASGVRRERVGPQRVLLGRLGASRVVMTATGIGRARAERGLRALLDAFPVAVVVGAGLAGGISPGLRVGELLVGRQVRDGTSPVADPDPSWVERALATGTGARGAVLVTVSEPAWSTESKAELWRTLSPAMPAAVDMESAAWARVAAERGVPYLIVRTILDRAEDRLPPFLARCRDREGSLRRDMVVRQALLRPRRMAELLALRRQVRGCAEGLAQFVQGLVASPLTSSSRK